MTAANAPLGDLRTWTQHVLWCISGFQAASCARQVACAVPAFSSYRSFVEATLDTQAAVSLILLWIFICTWYIPFPLSFHLLTFSFHRLATSLSSFKHFSPPLHAVYFLLLWIPPSCRMVATHTLRYASPPNKQNPSQQSRLDFTVRFPKSNRKRALMHSKYDRQKSTPSGCQSLTSHTHAARNLQASATSTIPCKNQQRWLQNPACWDVILCGG